MYRRGGESGGRAGVDGRGSVTGREMETVSGTPGPDSAFVSVSRGRRRGPLGTAPPSPVRDRG